MRAGGFVSVSTVTMILICKKINTWSVTPSSPKVEDFAGIEVTDSFDFAGCH
jgi:hypothetical protein